MDTLRTTERTRVKRLPDRARAQRTEVDAILDAAFIARIGYVIEGQPYVTPTAYWREGDYVYWHGSSASRMLRAQSEPIAVCVCVDLIDGLVLARSAFHHSLNYRSVMLLGTAQWVEDEEHKRATLKTFTDRLYPGRFDTLRPMNEQEFKATRVLRLKIDEGAAKVRSGPPKDDPEDLQWAAWAGVIPLTQQLGAPQADEHTAADLAVPTVRL